MGGPTEEFELPNPPPLPTLPEFTIPLNTQLLTALQIKEAAATPPPVPTKPRTKKSLSASEFRPLKPAQPPVLVKPMPIMTKEIRPVFEDAILIDNTGIFVQAAGQFAREADDAINQMITIYATRGAALKKLKEENQESIECAIGWDIVTTLLKDKSLYFHTFGKGKGGIDRKTKKPLDKNYDPARLKAAFDKIISDLTPILIALKAKRTT